jgi:hypothetical protein
MFEGWGIGEVLYCSWIIGAVVTALIISHDAEEIDTITASFLFCSLLWPLVWLAAFCPSPRRKRH